MESLGAVPVPINTSPAAAPVATAITNGIFEGLGRLSAAGSPPVPARSRQRHCLFPLSSQCHCLGLLASLPVLAWPGVTGAVVVLLQLVVIRVVRVSADKAAISANPLVKEVGKLFTGTSFLADGSRAGLLRIITIGERDKSQ